MYRQGRIVGAQGILTDISRRKIAEERMEYGKETLAMRVAEKTAQLTKVVRRLSCEIAERRQNEQQVVQCRDQLRLLTVELLKAEDEERQKIASDLHDRIGQNLALARMSLDQALAASVSDPQKEVLSQACDYLSDAIRDTRSLTCELSPPMLHELGIAAALESLLKQFRENHKMEFVLVCEGKTGELNRAINSALYRMTRELLVNAVKHSMAKRVEVNISAAPSSITLVVSDDGVGFDASAGPISSDNKGFGLFSIQERIGHLGGELRVEAEKGRGSRMTLFLPLVELRSVDNAQ
jgi:signal transduction histidine kinase